ncbi:MAG: cardiolipin synthase [Burkholderiales bacterium PBB3]|nr:MAG: cardiolipin synthase [Burkholderiales bacterium PBB3]
MLLLLLTGCASLPNLGPTDTLVPAAVMATGPTVTGSKGLVAPRASRTLLNQRWKNSYADLSALARVEEVITSEPLIAGNKLTLLYDGPQTMAAMMESMRGARDHINLETYIFDDDAVGEQIAQVLMDKSREGVKVHVMYDSIGTINTPATFFEKLQAAGITLLEFNPVNPIKRLGLWELNSRDHRKILVVDGAVAYTGGINISSTYANSSLFRSKSRRDGKLGWRDTHVKVEGPAVAALQIEFLRNWAGQQAPDLADANFFPPLQPQGDTLVRVLASAPDGEQEIYKSYLLAIRAAQKSIHITCAYFVPDPQILQALMDAARRGVDVKLVLAGVQESGLAYFAGHSFYEEMLASGIQLFQLQLSVLHAKTAVVDGLWSTVGSANIDRRSFLHNYELNVMVYDKAMGTAMEDAFTEDLRLSKKVTAADWAERPALQRVKEWLSSRLEYWL